ncbi:MAG: hypothetical protein ACE5GQ_08620 [Nitrospinales bacterium]
MMCFGLNINPVFAVQLYSPQQDFKIKSVNVVDETEFEGLWQLVETPDVYYSLNVTESYVAGFIVDVTNVNINFISGFISPGSVYFFSLSGFDRFEAVLLYDTPTHAVMTISECVLNGVVCSYVGAQLELVKIF